MNRLVVLLNLLLIISTPSRATTWSNVRALRYHPHSRIIGGDEVVPHSYPFQVGLLINHSAFCGGSLISPNYVLTAAHCGEVIRTVSVILGAHNITDDTETTRKTVAGSRVILHDAYDSLTLLNDIALIKLQESVILNDYIQVAKLPTFKDTNATYTDQTLTAIGWGITQDIEFPTIRNLSPVLRAVSVDVIDVDECEEIYYDPDYNMTYVNSNNICTSGYKNRGTCEGDSGSPLVNNENVVVGVVSFGTDLCEICSPSVFTKIASYLDWIVRNSDVEIS